MSDSSRIAWAFLSQYYSFLNKDPGRLHCFYTKKSTFSHGAEGGELRVCYGQQEIHRQIMLLSLDNCKVFISSVDSQSSAHNGIIVQVLGEMANGMGPWQKFAQTFFLAEQPNGYFVLNDICRYLREDEGDDVVLRAGNQSAIDQAGATDHDSWIPVQAEEDRSSPLQPKPNEAKTSKIVTRLTSPVSFPLASAGQPPVHTPASSDATAAIDSGSARPVSTREPLTLWQSSPDAHVRSTEEDGLQSAHASGAGLDAAATHRATGTDNANSDTDTSRLVSASSVGVSPSLSVSGLSASEELPLDHALAELSATSLSEDAKTEGNHITSRADSRNIAGEAQVCVLPQMHTDLTEPASGLRPQDANARSTGSKASASVSDCAHSPLQKQLPSTIVEEVMSPDVPLSSMPLSGSESRSPSSLNNKAVSESAAMTLNAPKSWASLAAGGATKWGSAAVATKAVVIPSSPIVAVPALPESKLSQVDSSASPTVSVATPPTMAILPKNEHQPSLTGIQAHPRHTVQSVQYLTSPSCFIKGVTEVVPESDLRDAIEARYGRIKELDVRRSKACAFLEFETIEGARAAILASIRRDEGGGGGLFLRGSDGQDRMLTIVQRTPKEQRPPPKDRPAHAAPLPKGHFHSHENRHLQQFSLQQPGQYNQGEDQEQVSRTSHGMSSFNRSLSSGAAARTQSVGNSMLHQRKDPQMPDSSAEERPSTFWTSQQQHHRSSAQYAASSVPAAAGSRAQGPATEDDGFTLLVPINKKKNKTHQLPPNKLHRNQVFAMQGHIAGAGDNTRSGPAIASHTAPQKT